MHKDGKTVLEQIAQTTTLPERTERASQCLAALNLSIPAIVDRPDNRVNELYAGWPDRLYVIGTDGRIALQGGPGPWGFQPRQVEDWFRKNSK